MKRPLLAVGLIAVVLAAARVCLPQGLGRADALSAGVRTFLPQDGQQLVISGEVCRKDDTSFYINSIFLYQDIQQSESNQQSDINQQTKNNQQAGGSIQAVTAQQPEANRQSGADDCPAGSWHKISSKYKFICETDDADQVAIGSRVTVRGSFLSFSEATNPGQFDSAGYYQSIQTLGKLKRIELLDIQEPRIGLAEKLYRLRCAWKAKLEQLFPQQEAALMSALLLGDRDDLDADTKEMYKRNGILHILSISSLHITIMGMGLYRLLRRFGVPVPVAALIGGSLMVLYGIMTGLGVSVCRAIGMYLLHMLAEAVGRTYDMLNALGGICTVMLLYNPGYIQNCGFLLSFSCVLGIGAVYPRICELYRGSYKGVVFDESKLKKLLRRLRKSVRESALISLSITLLTLPIQLWFFYEIPIFGMVINLMILPLVKPLLISGAAALLLPWGAFAPAWFAAKVLGWYETVCGLFDMLPFTMWNSGKPRLWQLLLYYGILLLLLKGKGKRRKNGRAVLALLCAGMLVFAIRLPQKNQVIFLDVGQGDCVIVRTSAGENYLFDCGSSSRSRVGQYILIPFLKYSGIHRLDGIFLSHPDGDHMNGVLELIALAGQNGIAVEGLFLPDIEEEAKKTEFGELLAAAGDARVQGGTQVRYVAAGDAWSSADVEFLCLNPPEGMSAENANAYSLCFYVRFAKENKPGFSMLLTGDVEGEGEKKLLEELCDRCIGNITLLKVAHHGSKYSTGEELLGQIEPQLAVISCGARNSYGHPHTETLERLENAGVQWFCTKDYGAITAQIGRGGKIRLRGYVMK